ncbi:MAG: hypothetical protein M3R30_10345 [Candidatus Eremiobacteraeota bacterium]|nr:hypothetical protein [Candidatus Eremiobacteraeota bacterium]
MKRTPRTSGFLYFLGRLGVAALASIVFLLVGIQFARVIGENVAMAHELASVQGDIKVLEARKRTQLRELRRLADPEGVIPEIHDRLRLVGPNEAIVFVKPSPAPPK